MLRRAVAFGALLGAVAAEAHGQTVVGRVTAERDGAALGSVAVTLLRPSNEIVREVLTDAEGRYRLVAPGAGDYRVVTDHLGYQRLDSPLFSITDGQTVTIDFELPTDAIEIEGVEVEVRRAEELRRRVVQYGVRLDQIGRRYVPRSEIERRLHSISIGQVLQWQNLAGITTRGARDRERTSGGWTVEGPR